MKPPGDVAMPEFGVASHRPPQEQLEHISEERSSQMRGLESSQNAPSSKTGSLRDSFESPNRRNSGQRRSGGESLEKQRNSAGQKDPEKEEDKQFLDSASDVSDLPALPSRATYLRKRAARGFYGDNAGVPDCLTPFSERLRSNRSGCTLEAVDSLMPAHESAVERMDEYLEQERRNSWDRELSLGSQLDSQSFRSLAASQHNLPASREMSRQYSV